MQQVAEALTKNFWERPYPASKERQREIAAAEKAEARRKEMERIERTGILSRYRNASLNSVPAKVRDYAAAFRHSVNHGEEFSRNLVLIGDYGAGKTYAACAVLLDAMKAERPNGVPMVVRFISAMELVRRARDEARGLSASATVKELGAVPLLCIDDLGKEPRTDFALSTMFELIYQRNGDGKPTIYTMQYTPDEIMRRNASQTFDEKMAGAEFRRIFDDAEQVEMKRNG